MSITDMIKLTLNDKKIFNMEEKQISIQKAQEMVDQWIKTIGVRYFSELTNMTILTEEVGELARIMARKFGDQSFKKSDEKYDNRCKGFEKAVEYALDFKKD